MFGDNVDQWFPARQPGLVLTEVGLWSLLKFNSAGFVCSDSTYNNIFIDRLLTALFVGVNKCKMAHWHILSSELMSSLDSNQYLTIALFIQKDNCLDAWGWSILHLLCVAALKTLYMVTFLTFYYTKV